MSSASEDAQPVPAAPTRLSSVKLAAQLTRLTFPDGRSRWDPARGAQKKCLHCASSHDVKRHLCVSCRTAREPFYLSGDVPQDCVYRHGYRWCQRQCSGVPLPLSYFPPGGGKKCRRCARARRAGLAASSQKVASGATRATPVKATHCRRRKAAFEPSPLARKHQRVASSSPSLSSTPSSYDFVGVPVPQLSPCRTRGRPASVQVTTITTATTAAAAAAAKHATVWSTAAAPAVAIPQLHAVKPPAPLAIPKASWGPPTPTNMADFSGFFGEDVLPVEHCRSRSLDSKASTCTVNFEPSEDDEATAAALLGDATPMGLAALDMLLESF